MSDTKKITKKDIYATVIKIIEGKVAVDTLNTTLSDAIVDRMRKDIEQANKSGTKKETDNDRLNASIQTYILDTLEEKGEMVYADLVKSVQAKFGDSVSPQKVTANVTKIKAYVEKYEKGKGKEKKLYISLTEVENEPTTDEPTEDVE